MNLHIDKIDDVLNGLSKVFEYIGKDKGSSRVQSLEALIDALVSHGKGDDSKDQESPPTS